MRKRYLRILEIFLILIIIFICFVSILQTSLLHDNTIFGYNVYMITSGNEFSNGDIVLARKINVELIEVNDTVIYKEKDDIIAGKITSLSDGQLFLENNKNINEKQLKGVYKYRLSFISLISKVIKDKIWFIICLLIPFSLLFVFETICIVKAGKRKKDCNLQVKDFDSLLDNEKVIEELKNEVKVSNKKIEELEQTIQLPIEEIKQSIADSSKESDGVKDDTMILFTTDDIKEVIKKELESVKSKD